MRAFALFAFSALCISGSAAAAEMVDIGKREYANSCAVCHGMDGKGGTPILEVMKVAPPPLTQLAKKNGGVFPINMVYETIDGRRMVRSHGGGDMPVWGSRFRAEGAPASDDYPYNAEIFVRSRILAVIDYIYRLQEK